MNTIRTGYNIREGAQILSDRFAKDSAEVQTAPFPFPKDGAEPWSELPPQAALPSAEPSSRRSDFFLACVVWAALLLIVYFGAQWIGLL